jgi:hypothetical protein
VLQQLFNLSVGIAFLLRLMKLSSREITGRRSFEGIVGLDVVTSIPDATNVAFFRERLIKAGVIEGLFEMFKAYLRAECLQARGGLTTIS